MYQQVFLPYYHLAFFLSIYKKVWILVHYTSVLIEGKRWDLAELFPSFQIVEEEALIKNNNTCKDFLIEAMKYHLLPADQRHLIKTDRTRPRTPISIPKVIKKKKEAHTHLHVTCCSLTSNVNWQYQLLFILIQVMIVVGGQAPKAIRSVECYDFQEDRWYQVADLPSRRCRAGEFTYPVHDCVLWLDVAIPTLNRLVRYGDIIT